MNNQMKITLTNGVEIPTLGLGTFKMPEGKVVIQSVRKALELGYRHIDTAVIQIGVVTIPKSTHPERILENMQIFDFEISKEDMQAICSLDNDERVGHNPDRGIKQTKNKL